MHLFELLMIICLTTLEVKGQTDGVCLSLPRNPEPAEVTQGRPGKRGAVGPMGPPGPMGECTCSVSEEVEMLQQQVRHLTAKLTVARSEILINRNAISILNSTRKPRVESGWYDPGNGYQYLQSTNTQSWYESRRWCQSLGGDLAAVGIRDQAVRRLIIDNLVQRNPIWIGLSDLANEGTFVWVDGVPATNENTGWRSGQPDDGSGDEDCVHLNWPGHRRYRLNDLTCTRSDGGRALCEKRLGA